MTLFGEVSFVQNGSIYCQTFFLNTSALLILQIDFRMASKWFFANVSVVLMSSSDEAGEELRMYLNRAMWAAEGQCEYFRSEFTLSDNLSTHYSPSGSPPLVRNTQFLAHFYWAWKSGQVNLISTYAFHLLNIFISDICSGIPVNQTLVKTVSNRSNIKIDWQAEQNVQPAIIHSVKKKNQQMHMCHN